MERFVCGGNNLHAQLRPEMVEKMGIHSPEELHCRGENVWQVALALQKSGWVTLPFCNTLCSEGLGAHPSLSLEGARVREQPYQRIDELPEQLSLNFPRMEAMQQAMDRCGEAGLDMIYNVEGPFTILSSLVPMSRMFAALRKPQGEALLMRAEDWICQYSHMAMEHGARVLSFSDPVATVDILGSKVFEQNFLPSCRRLVMRLCRENPGVVLHLCGKLTQSLLDTQHAAVTCWVSEKRTETYGETLRAFSHAHHQGGIVGHFCVNMLSTKRNWLYEIQL